MKINKIKLESQNNGLSNIKMIKLDRIVCIAGPNGSGKSRLLKSIKDKLKIKTTTSQLENINVQIADYNKNIESFNLSLNSNKQSLSQLNHNDSNYKQQFDGLNTNILNLQKSIDSFNESLESDNLKIKGYEIDTGQILDSYKYIDFVPTSKVLKGYGQVLLDTQKEYLNHLIIGSPENLENLNEQVFSIIYQINHDYVFSISSTTISNKEKDLYKMRWNNLVIYVKHFLAADLSFTNEPVLFNMPLNGEILSKGQSILLQFCVMLSLQDTKLDELIIFMDEPENHLHPDVLLKVIDKIKAIIPNGQLWIATHSIHILSYVEPDSIWYMQNGEIHHHRKKVTELLESLIGKEDKIKRLLNYLSLPSNLASINFTYECLFDPISITTSRDDPQLNQIIDIFREKSCPTILDFGSGQGRLLSIINEICNDKGESAKDFVDYYAIDINLEENCKNIIENVYGDSNRYIINPLNSSEHKLLDNVYKNKFDLVLMCNVLHEIEPIHWKENFERIKTILKDDGFLLIVEDQFIQHGEKAYDNGFIILNQEQFEILFNINHYRVEDEKRDGRLKAHFIAKNNLDITNDTLSEAIKSHKENAFNKLQEIRAIKQKEVKYIDGLNHSFWTQQYVNCDLILTTIPKDN